MSLGSGEWFIGIRLDRENETDFKTRISYEARSADVGTRTNVKA